MPYNDVEILIVVVYQREVSECFDYNQSKIPDIYELHMSRSPVKNEQK